MQAATRELVQRRLWPPGAGSPQSVWAVLDGARDPRIRVALAASRLDYRSLFRGVRSIELERASPQVVELLPGHHFTERLLEEGWGGSWCIFARLSDPTALYPHLRRLLRVREQGGRYMLFRFYDPRVLRVFLPTCLPAELQTLFGPVETLFCESEGGSRLLEFSLRGERLHEQSVAVAQGEAA